MADAETEVLKRKRPRRPREAASLTTPDPVEIAMQTSAAQGTAGDIARDLLERQSRLIDADLVYRGWQITTERVTAALRGLITLAVLALLILLLLMAWSASQSRNVVIEPFDVPDTLARQGLGGRVVAGRVLDTLAEVQAASRSPEQSRGLSSAWAGDIAVTVPQTGISVGELQRLLRRMLGDDTHVEGDILDLGDGKLALTIRGDGIAARTFYGEAQALPALTRSSAEYAFGQAEPVRMVRYLYQNGRSPDGEKLVRRHYPRAPADKRATVLNMWGNLLWGLRRPDEAIERYRMALAIEPRRWATWSNLVGALMVAGREQDAIVASGHARSAAAAAPPDAAPGPDDLQYLTIPVENWGQNLEGYKATAAEVQGGAYGSIAGPMMAYAAARLHDWSAARRYLLESDPDDETTIAHGHLVEGLRLLEFGDTQRAVAPLQEYHRAWMRSEQVYSAINDAPCWLADALARTNRRQEAEALARVTGRYMYCFAARATALEQGGDRAGAEQVYGATIALAPGLPFPRFAHGLALLGRGDLAGASRRFAQAHRLGPRWAEPLKYLGDALAGQGRHVDAVRRYRSAAERAPRWGALHLAWARALLAYGDRDQAYEKLQAAAAMDLSQPDRALLRRMQAALV